MEFGHRRDVTRSSPAWREGDRPGRAHPLTVGKAIKGEGRPVPSPIDGKTVVGTVLEFAG